MRQSQSMLAVPLPALVPVLGAESAKDLPAFLFYHGLSAKTSPYQVVGQSAALHCSRRDFTGKLQDADDLAYAAFRHIPPQIAGQLDNGRVEYPGPGFIVTHLRL